MLDCILKTESKTFRIYIKRECLDYKSKAINRINDLRPELNSTEMVTSLQKPFLLVKLKPVIDTLGQFSKRTHKVFWYSKNYFYIHFHLVEKETSSQHQSFMRPMNY